MRATLLCTSVVLLSACSGSSNSIVPGRTPATPSPTLNPTTVSGVVVDASSGQPLPETVVEWSPIPGIWAVAGRRATTGADGRYRMEIPISGPGASQDPIYMRAMKAGYGEQQQTVTLVLNGDSTVNFRLSR